MTAPARFYSSIAVDTTLLYGISNSETQIVLASTAGYPDSYPFTLAIGFDTSSEELVDVTGIGTLTNSYVITRGVDSTPAVLHSAGVVVKHVITGRDMRETQAHYIATTSVHGIADTSNIALKSGSTLTSTTLTSPTINNPVINSGSITGSVGGNPAFTGTVTLPSTTSIGPVTATELGYVDGVTSAIQTQLDTLTASVALKAPLSPSTNAQTGTAYTPILSDAGKFVEMNNASANTFTVPPNSSVAYPIGTEITIIQTGAGTTTIALGAGVTVNYYSLTGAATRTIKAQWAAATLIKRATDTWVLIGNLG